MMVKDVLCEGNVWCLPRHHLHRQVRGHEKFLSEIDSIISVYCLRIIITTMIMGADGLGDWLVILGTRKRSIRSRILHPAPVFNEVENYECNLIYS